MLGSQVAVFIDAENAAWGQDSPYDAGGRAACYAALDRICLDRGSVTLRRAYGDWTRLLRLQDEMTLHGIDLIQVARHGADHKNAVDMRLAVDTMACLVRRPEVDTYVLVAGDGDYSPLVQRLREFGKTVVGIGTEASASARLRSACTEYAFWSHLRQAVEPPTQGQKKRDDQSALRLLLSALAVTQGTQGWVNASALKSRMLALDDAFDNKRLGAKTFSEFLELPGIRGAVKVRRVGQVVEVAPR